MRSACINPEFIVIIHRNSICRIITVNNSIFVNENSGMSKTWTIIFLFSPDKNISSFGIPRKIVRNLFKTVLCKPWMFVFCINSPTIAFCTCTPKCIIYGRWAIITGRSIPILHGIRNLAFSVFKPLYSLFNIYHKNSYLSLTTNSFIAFVSSSIFFSNLSNKNTDSTTGKPTFEIFEIIFSIFTSYL